MWVTRGATKACRGRQKAASRGATEPKLAQRYATALVDTRQQELEIIIRLLQTGRFNNIVVEGDILYMNLYVKFFL